jgi:hypothetical protein|nr:MAG TPA: hypothetical protein [Caudoviricetes sp.]
MKIFKIISERIEFVLVKILNAFNSEEIDITENIIDYKKVGNEYVAIYKKNKYENKTA